MEITATEVTVKKTSKAKTAAKVADMQIEQPVTQTAAVKPVFVRDAQPETTRINPRISVLGALVNLVIFLIGRPKTENEKNQELQEMLLNFVSLNVVKEELKELIAKGYVDGTTMTTTPYGIKLAMVSTSPTPDLKRLADADRNMAFAMMAASYSALRNIHIKEEDVIPGKKGDGLVRMLRNVSNYTYNRTATHFNNEFTLTEEI